MGAARTALGSHFRKPKEPDDELDWMDDELLPPRNEDPLAYLLRWLSCSGLRILSTNLRMVEYLRLSGLMNMVAAG